MITERSVEDHDNDDLIDAKYDVLAKQVADLTTAHEEKAKRFLIGNSDQYWPKSDQYITSV